jgi:hypothetical protein
MAIKGELSDESEKFRGYLKVKALRMQDVPYCTHSFRNYSEKNSRLRMMQKEGTFV